MNTVLGCYMHDKSVAVMNNFMNTVHSSTNIEYNAFNNFLSNFQQKYFTASSQLRTKHATFIKIN